MKQMIVALIMMVWSGTAMAQETMRLAVTTSFHNSGLADVSFICPVIE